MLANGAWSALSLLLIPDAQGRDGAALAGQTHRPRFVDTHVHYPQVDVIGSPADGLLPWLETTPSG